MTNRYTEPPMASSVALAAGWSEQRVYREGGEKVAAGRPMPLGDTSSAQEVSHGEGGLRGAMPALAATTTHKLMHLSDLHFGAHDPQVCAAVQRLAHRLAVDVVVVSGDLTQRATRQQFAMAHEFVCGLGVNERVVLAGNHDLPLFAWWLRWGRAYQRFSVQFGAQLEPQRQVGPFCIFGVNTTRPWRHERGTLSSAQVERVAADLRAAPANAWRIVVSHHPLVARSAEDRSHRPYGADAAVQRWRDAGAHMLLSGHVHEPGLLQPLPGLWSMQAGTAVSHRLRSGQPNSLVVLQMQAASADEHGGGARRFAQRWDFDARLDNFVCVESMPVAG